MKPPLSGLPIKRTPSITRTGPEGVRLIKAVVNSSVRLTLWRGLSVFKKYGYKLVTGLVLTNKSQLKPAYSSAALIYYFEFDVDHFFIFYVTCIIISSRINSKTHHLVTSLTGTAEHFTKFGRGERN